MDVRCCRVILQPQMGPLYRPATDRGGAASARACRDIALPRSSSPSRACACVCSGPPRPTAALLTPRRFTHPGRGPSAIHALAIAAVALAVTAACRSHDPPLARDAPIASDAPPPVDAAPPPIDADARPAPTPVRLVASGDSTCALLSDHTIRCWGDNAHGQLGNGQTADAASPVTPDLRAVVDLQLADATACALLDDASVACWGRIGWHGREDVLRPTGVLGVIGVKRIFVLPGRACARVANDSLVCWGNVDARGHFAPGAHRVPTPVVGLDHVAGLLPDGAFSDDGRMWRWASDGVPRRVDVTGGVRELAARDGELCALLDGGRVMCVDGGRCGSPPPSPTPAARPPATRPASPAPRSTGHAAKPGSKPAAAKPTATRPAAHPAASESPGDPAQSPGFAAARQLAFDVGFCAVTTTGRLQCGDGCRRLDPIALERVDTLVGRCALLKSGTVACFDGTRFAAVSGVQRATALAVGRAHACALAGGAIRCWGDPQHGQLGDFAIPR